MIRARLGQDAQLRLVDQLGELERERRRARAVQRVVVVVVALRVVDHREQEHDQPVGVGHREVVGGERDALPVTGAVQLRAERVLRRAALEDLQSARDDHWRTV